jgi:ElaB/YqjD/DUF883 family membrane-anchored ribosome-binding protein
MDFESLKKLAQNTLETAKEVAGKATASAVEGVRSVAPESFENVVKSVTDTASGVVGRVTEKATGAVEALRETQLRQSIVEGASTLADTATSVGGRVARAAQAATEAFIAEPPGKDATTDKDEATGAGNPPPPLNAPATTAPTYSPMAAPPPGWTMPSLPNQPMKADDHHAETLQP